MADSYGKGKSRRKGGKKGPEASEWDYDGYGKGYGGNHQAASMGGAAAGGKPSKDIVHHYPPKEMAADVGYPVRGGQTLLIAYFPWEASEGDIEREFSKFCRVKRVHLVVDKSSRKPRCFGFVKFLSKADAEEALRATTQGLVQLPDTRRHVWHLKAEWTKSGDMVVDDSEAEQEVAKRKEERRSRTDTTPGRGGTSAPPPKGALHPGVPAPLPPLQTRYPPQAAIGMPPPPPLQQSMAHSHAVPPLQQPLPPQGQLYGQHMYGQGQQLYGSQASIYSGLPVPGRDPAALDAPGLPSAAAPPLLRDINSYAQASQQAYPGAPGYAAAVAAHHAPGYPPQSAQSYVGQQPHGSQQPYVSSQQAAAYSAGRLHILEITFLYIFLQFSYFYLTFGDTKRKLQVYLCDIRSTLALNDRNYGFGASNESWPCSTAETSGRKPEERDHKGRSVETNQPRENFASQYGQ